MVMKKLTEEERKAAHAIADHVETALNQLTLSCRKAAKRWHTNKVPIEFIEQAKKVFMSTLREGIDEPEKPKSFIDKLRGK